MAGVIGVDPQGSNAKDVINVLAGLDPQSLERIRSGLAATSEGAQPGQVSEMAKGLLSGAVPPETMLSMVSQAMQPPMMAGGPKGPTSFESEEQEFGISEAGFGFYPKGKQAAPGQATFPKAPTTGWEPTVTRPEEEEPLVKPIPFPEPSRLGGPKEEELPPAAVPKEALGPARQEVEAEIPGILGVEPGRYRLEDLHKAGWNRIPDRPQAREKMFDEIRKAQGGVVDTITISNQLADLVRGRPEAMDFFSLGKDWRFNLAATWMDMVSAVGGTYKTITGASFSDQIKVLDEIAKTDPLYAPSIAKIGDAIGSYLSGKATAEEAAIINARVRAMMVPLAYALAASKGQTSNTLSNTDVAFALDEIGKSPTPEKMIASLQDLVSRTYQDYVSLTKTKTGKEIPVEHMFTQPSLDALKKGGLNPEGIKRKEIKVTEGPGRFSPGTAPGEVETAFPGTKVPRTGITPEQEEANVRRRAEEELSFQREQRTAFRTEQARAEERQEMARRGEARQERSEARQARGEERAIAREERMIRDKQIKDIQDTFVQLGRSLRSQQQIGVQLPGAPGQEAGAFQVGGIPRERRAPAIPGRR
jgi:hypothetical protein